MQKTKIVRLTKKDVLPTNGKLLHSQEITIDHSNQVNYYYDINGELKRQQFSIPIKELVYFYQVPTDE